MRRTTNIIGYCVVQGLFHSSRCGDIGYVMVAWWPAALDEPAVPASYLPPLTTGYFHALTTNMHAHFHRTLRCGWSESRNAACYRSAGGLSLIEILDQDQGCMQNNS